MMNKHYLGDGAYIQYDGWGYSLTTEDGISTTNIVYLEPSVLKNFQDHIKLVEEAKREQAARAAEPKSG